MTPTTIGWADAVWNPVAGCSVVSPECRHCYAMEMARRHKGKALAMTARGEDPGRLRHAPEVIGPNGRWNGKVFLLPDRLGEPAECGEPLFVFVNPLSDTFHERLCPPHRTLPLSWSRVSVAGRTSGSVPSTTRSVARGRSTACQADGVAGRGTTAQRRSGTATSMRR
jgi:hypothetical protein